MDQHAYQPQPSEEISSAKKPPKSKSRAKDKDPLAAQSKRRCVSTACIACRRRKSKCDGNIPSCAACSSVYGTECIYDPSSDHRRKGVYKKDIDNLKTRNSTLQTLIQAILNYPEDEVAELVRQIRNCESLDDVAENILSNKDSQRLQDDDADSPINDIDLSLEGPTFETQLSGRMGELKLEDGSVRFIGGTSNLIFLSSAPEGVDGPEWWGLDPDEHPQYDNPLLSWTTVTDDTDLINHLMTMYFTWHYTYFTTLSKNLFYRDFRLGAPSQNARKKTRYCSALLVNAMLALGCHFTSRPEARDKPDDSATAGDHFFREAKRLIMENDEHEKPQLTTVQALALMSVREAGCGRETKGWVYSGMSFRMAYDMGLNLESGGLSGSSETNLDEQEVDARRVTIWGCFLFDKCWSNYLGRQPQLLTNTITATKFDVFPFEDAEPWSPVTDLGVGTAHVQPSRTRAVALQIAALCEISSDLLTFFYHPSYIERNVGKQAELKKLSEIHTRLEAWKKNLPKEMEPREGALPSVLLMHMFFQLLFIHLFRPFLRYTSTTSPLPQHVSPRKLCTQAASAISKLMRLYKRSYGLRQICNVAVYMCHSACTIHLLNLPDKAARRDITHGVKHLEEIAEGWLCARRTLGILTALVDRWKIADFPDEAREVLDRCVQLYHLHSYGQSPSRHDSASDAGTAGTNSPQPIQHLQPILPSNHNLARPPSQQPHLQPQFYQTQPMYTSVTPMFPSQTLNSSATSSNPHPYALDSFSNSYYNPLPSQPSYARSGSASTTATAASTVTTLGPSSNSTIPTSSSSSNAGSRSKRKNPHTSANTPGGSWNMNANGGGNNLSNGTVSNPRSSKNNGNHHSPEPQRSQADNSPSPSALLTAMGFNMPLAGAATTTVGGGDGQDWWFRDHVDLMAGFDNWMTNGGAAGAGNMSENGDNGDGGGYY